MLVLVALALFISPWVFMLHMHIHIIHVFKSVLLSVHFPFGINSLSSFLDLDIRVDADKYSIFLIFVRYLYYIKKLTHNVK
jgi:hypothetical protein